MGGLVQSIGNLFGGSSVNTDRKQQLAGYGDLSNVFNYGFNQGKTNLSRGTGTEQGALGQLVAPANYYQKLLTGNRAAAMSAVAPTVNAINAQTDAASKQASTMGTARGGGVNAGEQQIDTAKQGAVENAITGARAGAAQGAESVAGATGQIGGNMANQALNLLGLGEKSAGTLTELAGQSRLTSDQLHRQKAAQAGGLTNSILDVLFGTGSSGAGSLAPELNSAKG